MSAAAIEQITEGQTVNTPGVYDIDEAIYHADPVAERSLSFSGAKRLLPPSCPARFKWERDNGRPDTAAFDFGHAAHKLVLGAGAEIKEVNAKDWRTKVAKEAAAEARLAGQIPLLADDCRTVEAMAEALRAHPVAASLFAEGTPEASLFWTDDETSVMRRGRVDWLPDADDGRMIIPDYKSAISANPEKFGKSAADYCYHQQAAWYIDGAVALGLAETAAFVFVVQEKTPPYIVTICELDATAIRIGRALNREALDIYVQCMTDDHWPAYSDDVEHISLPYYYTRNFEDSL